MSVFDVVPLADRPALLAAFARNCCCEFDAGSNLVGPACESCIVLTEPINLMHLVFARMLNQQLLLEEFRVQDPVAA